MSDLSLNLRIRANADGTVSVINGVGNSINTLGQSARQTNQATQSLTDTLKRMGHLAAAYLGVTGVANDLIKVNREMQSLRTSLETVTGSSTNAQAAFEKIQNFASATPYSVQQVTEAFIKLSNLGLKAGKEELTSYGNTASAMGKSLNQMVEAIADAATGEFERLKEFGIKSKVEGDNVAFTFQGVQTRVKNSAADITGYLQTIGNTNFAGGMERQAKTIDGALSNLGDSWNQFLDNLIPKSGEESIARWISGLAANLEEVGKSALIATAALVSYGVALGVEKLVGYVAAQVAAAGALHATAVAALTATAATTAAAAAQATGEATAAGAELALASAHLAAATSMTARMAAANALNVAMGVNVVATTAATEAIAANALAQEALTAATSITARAMAGLRAIMLTIAAINPFTWIVAAIGAAATAAYLYRDSLLTVGESTATVGEVMESVWLLTKNAAEDAIDAINSKFPPLSATVADIAGFIGDVFNAAWGLVKAAAALAVDGVVGLFVGMGSALGVAAGGIVTVFSQAFEKVKGMAGGLGLGIKAALSGDLSFSDFKAALQTKVKSVAEIGKETRAAFVSGFIDSQGGAGKMVDALGASFDGLGKKVADGANTLHALNTMVKSNADAADTLHKKTTGLAAAHSGAGEAAKAQTAAHKGLSEAQKAANKEMEDAKRLTEAMRSPQEVFNDATNAAVNHYNTGRISLETLTRALTKYSDELKNTAGNTESAKRQQEQWNEAVKQANELYDLKRDTSDTQELARMAESLHLMGATNAEIKQRIELEKQLGDAVRAHPDQDPQVIRDNIIAQQRASDEIAQYTDSNSTKSGEWMEAAFKKAAENIQDSFARMFENMLNGEATASLEKFAENIKKTLNQAISQQLALDLQNLFTGKGGVADMFKSAMLFGVSMLASWLTKKPNARTASPSEVGNSAVLGTGAMHIADGFSRDQGYEYQSKSIVAFNKSLDYLTGTVMNQVGKITDWIGVLGAKLSSISVVAQVAEFFRPVTTLIGQGLSSISALYSSVTGFISAGITAMTNFVGLTTAATAGVVDAISTGAAGTGTAGAAAAETAAGATASALSKVAVALVVIKFGYDMFTNWSNDTLTLQTKVTNSLYAMSDALLAASAATLNWPLAIAAAALNVAGVVSDVLENGFGKSNMLRLLLGPLSGLFDKQRTPNAWMNTYNPDQGGGQYSVNQNAATYTATGNKSAYVGEQTPFGMTVISTHEMSLSAAEMVNAFGGLLTTVKAVDTDLYHTINRLDAKFDETGKTMAYYNNLLKDGNPGATSVSTKQNASDLNTGGMLTARYNWITDQLAASGSQVGQYINAWFDVITNKFISVSKDNSMFVLGVIDSLATNLESFMQFPLALVGLIGSSVKSVRAGGTPDAVMAEIMGVLNTFTLVKTGFQQLNLAADDNRIVAFLAGINAIGYGVQDAGLNLLAYGIALQKIGGAIAASGNELMSTVEAKFASLKNQGMDTTQINAFFGSFGIMANMFAEAGVAFGEADLDSAAKHLHDMAKASVEVAKNTIDHAIANEKLTGITRAAAIATLVKTGKLEEAVVAEAEYGISIQNATKDMLAQMGFIQQLGFAANKSLSDMGIGASAWTAAANNVVSVFGDMEKAMSWLDATAKTFLSVKDYTQYNLDTIDRGISNIKESNPSLAGITDASIREAFKSGAAALDLITELAKNLGGEAPTIKALVDLYGQRVAAEEALNTAMGRTTETVEQATARYQELQSAISASNTDFARRNNSAVEKELFALHDGAIKTLMDWKALGAASAEMQVAYDQAITRGAEATAKAIESIQNAFASIYQSIAKKRTSMSDDMVRVTAPSTLSGIQQQRARADLASDDYATQMAAVDTLHKLIMDSYNRQIDAAKTLVDATKAIGDYLNKLLLNKALTTLSPEAMLSESRAQYGVQLALAKAGDQDAIRGITQIADSYLSTAKDYYASTEDYVAIFNQIRGDLAGLTTSTTLEQRTTIAVETMTGQLATLTEALNAIEDQQRVKEAGQIDAVNSSAAAILASLNAAILAIDGISINLVGGLEAFRLALLLDLESMILTIDVIPNIPDSVKELAAEVARNMELTISAIAGSSLPVPIKQLALDNLDGIIKMVNLTVAASSNDPATIALGLMAANVLAKQVAFYVTVGGMSDEVRIMGLGVTGVLRKYATVVLTSELDLAGKTMGLDMLDVARKYTDLIINSTLDTTAKNLKLNEADVFVKAALLQLTTTGAFTPDQRALIDAVDGMMKTVTMTGSVSISGLTPQIVAVLDALPSATKTLTLNEVLAITGVDATTAGIIQAAPDSVKTLTLNQVLAKYSGFIDIAALAVLNSAPSSIKSLTLNEILAIYGLDATTNAVLTAAPNASKSLTLAQYVSLGSMGTQAKAILDMPGSSSKSLTAGVTATLSGNLDAAKIAANGVTGTTSYVTASATLTLDSVLNNSILSYSKSEVANVYNAIANNTAATAWWLSMVHNRLGQPSPVSSVHRSGMLATFAKGGIAREASIFGEAGPEAAVPLPDGRSIPVTLSGNNGSDNKETVAELKQQTQELKAARREANQKADAMIQRLAMMERRLAQIEATGALAGAA